MTDARLAGSVSQVVVVVDPTTNEIRDAGSVTQVVMSVTGVKIQTAGLVSQVAMQVNRSNVTSMDGYPLMDLSTGTPRHIQSLT